MKENIKDLMKKIKVPHIDFERIKREVYEANSANKNNLSYWFPKIKNCGFNVPETHIIPIDFKLYEWLTSDKYSKEDINNFRDFIIFNLNENKFNTNRKLFIKTGTFSDKFDFSHCKLTDINNIGQQFLNIYYTGMMFGADKTNELVIREFIESESNKKTIYNGMPLNTEFRVFYDFDKREVMDIFNYWDREVMIKSLMQGTSIDDVNNFQDSIDNIEKDYENKKSIIIEQIKINMKNIDLQGQWSIDIMSTNDKLYLIDMALAEDSYYFDKVKRNN